MPAKKKRNNKPKYAKKTNHTITPITNHHSSPAIQYQGEEFQEDNSRASSMEDSSSGKVDEPREVVVEDVGSAEIDVESVKTLDIVDDNDNDNDNNPEPESKRDISILEEIVDEAKKILGGDSSSSSDSEEAEREHEKEENAESSLVEKLGVDAIPSIVEGLVSNAETKLKSVFGHDDEEKEAVVDKKEEANQDEVSKKIEENIGEPSKAVCEAPIENVESSQISQTLPIPSVVPVTRDSLQAASWKSCCGLLEVLRGSER